MGNTAIRILVAACVAAACFAALPGCATTSQATSEEAQAQANNRQYMSRVNQISMDIADSLSDFEAAVQSGDLAAMRTAANAASRSVDELSSLEAPEALSDIKAGYVDGCSELRDALSDYIQLYADVADSEESLDSASYEERLSAIQERYDAAVQKISDADALAASL